jgi:membrane-bound ClpP family serine protease
MFKGIDQNQALIRLLKNLSTTLARNRGLPMVIGLALVIVGMILQVLNVFVPSQWLAVLGIVCHNVGIIAALIGFLVSEPLGG